MVLWSAIKAVVEDLGLVKIEEGEDILGDDLGYENDANAVGCGVGLAVPTEPESLGPHMLDTTPKPNVEQKELREALEALERFTETTVPEVVSEVPSAVNIKQETDAKQIKLEQECYPPSFFGSFPVNSPSSRVSYPGLKGPFNASQHRLGKKLEEAINTLTIKSFELESPSSNDDENSDFELLLRPHQRQGVAFLVGLERSGRIGGILADYMGFGKTIQGLGVIVYNRPDRRYFSGCPTTLVVCPLSVMDQWESETRKFAPHLKVMQYHGARKCRSATAFSNVDVVLVTYHQVRNEHGVFQNADADRKNLADCPLFQVTWFRVIMDEAHYIRNHERKTSIACRALSKQYGHCLTGTPAQNSIDDIYALFDFLGVDYISRWNRFEALISEPAKYGWYVPYRRLQPILAAIMLRRTHETTVDGRPIVELAPRKDMLLKCCMTDVQRAFYHFIDKHCALGPLPKLIRYRQVCDHPVLVRKCLDKPDEPDEPDEIASAIARLFVNEHQDSNVSTSIGRVTKHTSVSSPDPGVNIALLRTPQLCEDCLDVDASLPESVRAPGLRPNPLTKWQSKFSLSSSKIQMVLHIFAHIRSRYAGDKVLIVSKFRGMLDLVAEPLALSGVRFVSFNGSLSKKERQEVLRCLAVDDGVEAMLMTLDAGGTGLNITSANHVILLEPWWNPFVEEQCFGRVHRIGQAKDVFIYRLYCPDTIEDHILKLQQKKRELISGAFGGQVELENGKLKDEATQDDRAFLGLIDSY